ncbi:catechol 2,3-dioxygenase [Aeribacillus sp. FSL K6-1121]|uniref:catechol 2,3-dioxygenase n=1 Tax=Aeribacillus TaxID=1055323 RepID=UPI002E1FB7DE|nr:catechol 2,3-dioxygenase [Aeribacillus composti]MED0747462.1 catechol 2,3-dioxygenase [Aeribacillus composti]
MNHPRELDFDIAHLGHVELLTPKFEESTFFFKNILGLQEVYRNNESVYLRCWGDYEEYSIKLTKSDQAGVGHTALRTISAEALERKAKAIEATGRGIGWIDGDKGHGRAYRYYGPDGHIMELYYESNFYQAPDHLRPTLKNQPQKFTGHGAAVKTLDHINYLSSNPEADGEFAENVLGLRLTEQIVMNDGHKAAVWYRATNKSYDLVYTEDSTGSKGRLHHIAFAVESMSDIVRAANFFIDHDVFIEFAPSKHAINQTYFVYVYEPGGNRIEVCSGGYLILAPDWKPITWTEEERKRGQAWGNKTVETFHTYGTPIIAELDKAGKK